jgi:anaerobic selenocysteine-containing dehydrogenase
MRPAAADAQDIEDWERIVVENDRGATEVEIAVTPAIKQSSVFLPFQYSDPAPNFLTGDALDPEIPEYKHSAVTVTPAS